MKKKKTNNKAITDEMFIVLDLIVAEFNSDPMSVACFPLEVVARAKKVTAEYKNLDL